VANKTNNYKLPKPDADDFYDISEYNKTMDMLDDSLTEMDQKKLDKNGDASEAITEFEQEILRENIESGETLSSTFGKVKKWFSEMKDVAFSGHAKDVATDAAHRFVSDAEKSSWNDKLGASGGDISETIINFLESTTTEFPIPEQGETSKVFFGKMKKFIQDFNNLKSGIITVGRLVNSGNVTSEGYALDARYGKTLFDLYSNLNNDLNNKYYMVNCKSASINVKDIRGTNIKPNELLKQAVSFSLANASEIGLSGLYIALITIKPWVDETANSAQLAINLSTRALYIRLGNNDTWGSWIEK
jgi:hypothetical protein